MICPKDGTEMRPTYEPYEHRCPKCGYWFDDYTGKEINPQEAAEAYGKQLEAQAFAKKLNQVVGMLEFHESVSIAAKLEDGWVYFQYFNNENDPPYQIKKVAQEALINLDWSMAVLLIQNAQPEPKTT